MFGCLPLDGPHREGWHADNASANSMTGWEPIVVKPLIILRQIKTVETERDALLRPSEEGTPAPGAMLKTLNGIGAEFVGVLWLEGLFRSFSK